METRILTDAELDAVAGGQATATFDVNASAAGVNTATVASTVTISTSDTDGMKTASIMGSVSSTSH
jgi:hypothetical protein